MLLVPAATAAGASVDITVTTISDRTNGQVATVAGLIASAGPDGISLPEAIEATNNDPGEYRIRFAPALRGRTITLGSELPPLTGGGVTIEGSGVTLRPTGRRLVAGLAIASSGNRLRGLTLEGFVFGVAITPPVPLPTGRTFSGNTVSGLVMRDIDKHGVSVDPSALGNCAAPCRAYNRWVNTTIAGNTIEARQGGIFFWIGTRARVERTTVTENTVRVVGKMLGPGISFETSGDSTGARISDVLIARNSVSGSPDAGIAVVAGANRAQEGIVERLKILDNRIRLGRSGRPSCCLGIVVGAGDDSAEFAELVDPPRYLDGNLLRDVLVRGNSLSGTLGSGIAVEAGEGAGRRNRVRNARIERNVVRSGTPGSPGALLKAGGGTEKRYATGNRISGIWITGNTFASAKGPAFTSVLDAAYSGVGGIVLGGGSEFSRDNSVRDVRIAGNTITTSFVGISLIGGGHGTARGNRVACVRLSANRVTGTPYPVSVIANFPGASRNWATLRC